jgi:hypothetical protein
MDWSRSWSKPFEGKRPHLHLFFLTWKMTKKDFSPSTLKIPPNRNAMEKMKTIRRQRKPSKKRRSIGTVSFSTSHSFSGFHGLDSCSQSFARACNTQDEGSQEEEPHPKKIKRGSQPVTHMSFSPSQLVFEGPVTRPEKDCKKTGPQPHWTENRMDRSRPQLWSGPQSFLIF